jgi:hypothetical protein
MTSISEEKIKIKKSSPVNPCVSKTALIIIIVP